MKLRKAKSLIALVVGITSIVIFQSCTSKQPSTEYPYDFWTVNFKDSTYDVVSLEFEDINSLQFFYKDSNGERIGSIENLQESIPGSMQLVFATNGGIFSTSYTPLGLYIENGDQIVDLNLDEGEGNFFLQPNGVFQIGNNKADILKAGNFVPTSDINYALQSGPMLVIDDEINPAFNESSANKYIRSGVGIHNDGSMAFVISNQQVNLYDFASFFHDELDCKMALYLDGAISEMYIPKHRPETSQEFSIIIGILESAI